MDKRVENCLLGTCLGDSLGLVFEGLSRDRIAKLGPLPLRQRLVFGKGMLSDDSHQSVLTAMAIRRHPTNPDEARVQFARLLRTWFWTLPPGIGLSTAKACLRFTAGLPASRSGVKSAGNGAAMRSAVIGALYPPDHGQRDQFVTRLSSVTHTHPLAIDGAKLVALASAMNFASATGVEAVERFEEESRRRVPDWDFAANWPSRGPSGYVVHSVQAALGVWKSHPRDLESALEKAILMGGDTDSVAAIVGGIVGAGLDALDVPGHWYRWVGWPRPQELVAVMDAKLPYIRTLCTNGVGLGVVLGHGLRRLMPPY